MTRAIAIATWLGLAATSAPVAQAGEAGDAVFAERAPWALDGDGLTWDLQVQGPAAPGFVPVEDGSVRLTRTIDPADGQPVLQVTRDTGTDTRRIGAFPISGGDPVLVLFLEQTARDMAALTGGSPFYIRNRIKDAVFRGGRIARRDGQAIAVFHPFADDPNAARMGGFDTLALTFVLDGNPKAPIRQMLAATEGGTPGYLNRLVLE
ncbi:hypothetical protein [Paracoccus stylophorae]|uniref:hypothetical protein n=1 Tax=Paracoccus stylophorae TaxID=659350 RepID=UPI0023508FF3|nr:hypothetical protein [Paracoccus stylophorae]